MNDIRNMNIWKAETGLKKESNEWLGADVSELNLSVRAYNCLKRAGCHTVGDVQKLIAQEENGLRRIRNLGSRSEAEILENFRRFREEYAKTEAVPGNGQMKRFFILKPAKKYWDTEIEAFPLSGHALTDLKRTGIRRVRDLYETDPAREPGWYAVRELFEKLPL